jgi:hypothetical protein
MRSAIVTTLAIAALALPAAAAAQSYTWLETAPDPAHRLDARVPPPAGYQRVHVEAGSFAAWLRGLPLLEGRPDVLLHDGRRKGNQSAHHAVIDIDVGRADLQQCADAVMRLRAEYLYAAGRHDDIHFDFTSGDEAAWSRYRDGWRASIDGNAVRWNRTAEPATGRASFRRYLDLVFTYAGTHSLSLELQAVAEPARIQPGDVFIQGGFPGHAVLVLDVAEHTITGARRFLLSQSYMPAQQIHVLRNPADDADPWYPADFGRVLNTPEWIFGEGDLKRF